MSTHEELKAKAAATYNAAADRFDAPDNTFWDRFGRATVGRLRLTPGQHVLDVCAGSGASALPAADAVGPRGRVVAVDIADSLLALLERKATSRGLTNVEARSQDLLALDSMAETFDAVVCVFGIFFLADMAEGIRQLWGRVRPGGQLAITTWGPRAFEPMNGAFWAAIRDERPDLHRGFAPWDLITTPDAVRQLLRDGGVTVAAVEAEDDRHPLPTPESWWALVMGSGYRGTVDQLDEAGRARVKAATLQFMASKAIGEIEANAIYAVARKPVSP
jgi:ubiquinone/menaquinone biosynthesis C-methylase UbiE